MKFLILVFIYSSIFSSCATKKLVETDLYFGLSKPNDTIISDASWDNFVAGYIAKVFTKGFTQIKGEGKWLDTSKNKLIHEPSRIIVSVHISTKSFSAKIDSIRLNYKSMFNQQAVLRVDKKVIQVSF